MDTMTSRRGGLELLLYIIASLAVRLPFAALTPHHIDELNFLRALDYYSLGSNSPHVPGYPFFVALGRIARVLVGEPMLAYQLVNGVGAGICAWALADIAERILSRNVARWTGALALFSPLSWSYGFCSLSYGAASGITAIAIRECCLVLLGNPRRLLFAGIALGAAAGFRLEAPLFLFPVFAWATAATFRQDLPTLAANSPCPIPGALRRAALAVLACGAAIVPALLIPILSAGGLSRFRELSTNVQTVTDIFKPGVRYWPYFINNLTMFSTSTILVLGAIWLPVFLGLGRMRELFGVRIGRLLLIWALPSLFYYVALHQGQYGYWLPTLAQPIWIGAAALLASARSWLVMTAFAINVALVLGGGALAVDYPRIPLKSVPPPSFAVEFTTFYLQRYTAAGIAAKDETALKLMDYLAGNYDPDTTWIFTSPFEWMDRSGDHIMMLLPKFLPSVGTAHIAENTTFRRIPAKGRTILIVHADLMDTCRTPDRFIPRYRITEWDFVWEAKTTAGEHLWFDKGEWGIAPGGT